jgi:endonuclease/exonuclease/phosphatase family metal-dependent hydrolase
MRAALGASIALPGGEPLEVWNTHLSHGREAARNGQARSLAAALAASRPALLGGDFNAGLDSAALGALHGLALSPLVSDRIDHLLATAALLDRWVPVNVETLRFGANAPASAVSRPLVSDHPALFVELGRRPGGAW